jgi:hypothetical protein
MPAFFWRIDGDEVEGVVQLDEGFTLAEVERRFVGLFREGWRAEY